jgi:hypothetical protein
MEERHTLVRLDISFDYQVELAGLYQSQAVISPHPLNLVNDGSQRRRKKQTPQTW